MIHELGPLGRGGDGSVLVDAAGISLAIIAVVNGLGTNLNGKFSEINGSLK